MRTNIATVEALDWRWLTTQETHKVLWWPPLPTAAGGHHCESADCTTPATRIADLGSAGLFIFCDLHTPDTVEGVEDEPADLVAALEQLARKLQDLDTQRAGLVEQRARAIVAARQAGAPWGKLQDATGLTRQALNLIARGANGGELP